MLPKNSDTLMQTGNYSKSCLFAVPTVVTIISSAQVNPTRTPKKSNVHAVYDYDEGRETKEGWPLLTLETKVNGSSKRTNERGPSLVRSLGLSCRHKRFLFCLGCSSRPSRKYFLCTGDPYYVLYTALLIS